MREAEHEIKDLQKLLDTSYVAAGNHVHQTIAPNLQLSAGSSPDSVKVRHLRSLPAASATHTFANPGDTPDLLEVMRPEHEDFDVGRIPRTAF